MVDSSHCALALALICVYYVIDVHSLSFTLSAATKKCLREEVHKDVLVTGEYRLSEAPIKTHLTVSYKQWERLGLGLDRRIV